MLLSNLLHNIKEQNQLDLTKFNPSIKGLSFDSKEIKKKFIFFALQKKVQQNSQDTFGVLEFDVTVTMYNPAVGQTDSTPNETADGTIINPKKASEYRYVALSRDLLKRWGGPFDYGDYVVIEGTGKQDGVYQVRDTMNPRFTKRVDILKSKGSKRFKYNSIKLYKHNESAIYAYNN